MKKKNLKVLLSILLTAALAAGAFCISVLFRNQIPKPVTGELNVYFIDVGQADSVFLTCNGESMLIDGGNAEDAPTVTSFIKNLGIDTLDYVVATHAHEDHAGGLGGIIPEFTVKKVLSPVKEYNSVCFRNFVKSANEQCGITLCSAGERWTLGNAEIYSLWPLDAEDEETNNTSIVLKAVLGAVSYLFCGDLESDAETRLIETGADLSANKEYRTIIEAVGLGNKLHKYPSELSGGEQQRVSVARALAKNPKVLFLDEPTGALDEQTGRQVLDYISRLQTEYGFTIVMVTHNLNIAEMANTVIRMNSGRISEIYTNDTQKTAYEIGW